MSIGPGAMSLAASLRRTAARERSYKFTGWPGKTGRKQEVKQSLTQLDGQA